VYAIAPATCALGSEQFNPMQCVMGTAAALVPHEDVLALVPMGRVVVFAQLLLPFAVSRGRALQPRSHFDLQLRPAVHTRRIP